MAGVCCILQTHSVGVYKYVFHIQAPCQDLAPTRTPLNDDHDVFMVMMLRLEHLSLHS